MSHRIVRAAASAAIVHLLLTSTAFGHSQLTTATPGPDDEISTVPPELVANFSQNLDAGRSSIELRSPAGSRLATGTKDPDEPRAMRMPLPALEPGDYEVRWTTFSTEDGELARGTYTFSLLTATPPPASPSPSMTASPTVGPSTSAAPSVTASPSPPPTGSGTSATDFAIPLLAAALVVGGFGAWLLRRR